MFITGNQYCTIRENTQTFRRIFMNQEDKNSEIRKNRAINNKILFPEESYAIQGAVFDVYKEMGCGFLEAVYLECLEKELDRRSISFKSQTTVQLVYKGEVLEQTYIPDFICYDKILVEIKAVREIAPEHKAQILNYLKATGLELGLLVNFGSYPRTEIVRFACSHFRDFRAFRGEKDLQ